MISRSSESTNSSICDLRSPLKDFDQQLWLIECSNFAKKLDLLFAQSPVVASKGLENLQIYVQNTTLLCLQKCVSYMYLRSIKTLDQMAEKRS